MNNTNQNVAKGEFKTVDECHKYRPILFSTPMVKAILAGSKTQTRRCVKPQPDPDCDIPVYMPKPPALDWEEVYRTEWKPWNFETASGESIAMHCPYGQPGNILWVREAFCNDERGSLSGVDDYYYYKADMPNDNIWKGSWKPSIHMPKIACRIFLSVTNVRVERLHDISEADAIKEGVYRHLDDEGGFLNYVFPAGRVCAAVSFETLWQKINGFDSWNSNSWVWVIEFRRVERPTEFL